MTVAGGDVTLTSRNGNDLTGRFRDVARAATLAIRSSDAVLDGEICALDESGRSRFSLLQDGGGTSVLVLFDLLEVESEQVIDEPLAARRRRLEQLVGRSAGVLVSPQFDDGEALLEAARQQELEGVVAKQVGSPYRPGRRSPDWQKLKLRQTQEVVIAGYTRGQGRRTGGFGALVAGVQDAGELRWAGNVGTGFSDDEIERLRALLAPLERADSPFAEVPKMPRVRRSDITWVEPDLVAEVEFAEWTHEGRLRAPSYLRLREDRAASDVRPERVSLPPLIKRGRRELRFSNVDKPFWPELGITKGDLIAYYRDVAEVLVPHLRGRPFTMKRYPDGWQGKNFFQKNAPSHMPDWIERAPFPASTRDGEKRIVEYAVVNDDLSLLWMANMGCIDLHTWASRVDKPERPDWVMFDLDPSEGSGFEEVIEVAQLVKATLDLLELESFPKTSGSRGIHVLVPIARRHTFEEVREFAGIVAGALARAHPGLATTEWTKQKRRGVLVDANQNGPGRTNATVYSVRPRAGAPVSTPLGWDEVIAWARPAGVHDGGGARPCRAPRRSLRRCARRQAVAEGRAEVVALVAQLPRMAEHRELDDVAAEEERHRPVDDDAELSGEQRQLVQVVRPRDEPAGKAPEVDARKLGDPLEAAERRDLAEHPVPVRLPVAGQVLRESARLAQRVLARRRIDGARRLAVLDSRAVAERPHVLGSLDAERLVDDDPPALVERELELRQKRVRANAGRPDQRSRRNARAVGEQRLAAVVRLERRRDVDLDSASREPSGGVLAEPSRDLGEDLRRRVDEHPALRYVAQAGVRAQRCLRHVVQLCERFDARVARADEDEAELGRIVRDGSTHARAGGARGSAGRSRRRDP